ncbi:MFS transporter [Lacibacter sp. H375]|uniref:MFS transporter n=1 Tax=Lacibacter sp. H375 TaxID=3133424 RepID=UPI0030BD4821
MMKQGLHENRNQFILLVLVNAFVGAMVGLERTVMPDYAAARFQMDSTVALVSFIAAFGTTKAIFNLLTGYLHQHYNRKQILLLGWAAAIPVPFLLLYAQDWWMVIVANIFLGINQGLAWSSTVVMKVDLVGTKNRGLAMGINEFAGYVAVGLAGYLATSLAHTYGAGFYPFVPGIFFVVIGFLLSWLLVKDTTAFVTHEQQATEQRAFKSLWKEVSFRHFNMGSVNINGFINNLNDGVLWGLLPIWLLSNGYSILETGSIAAIYPAVWGISQLFAGKLGDHFCKKQLLTVGMLLQAAGIVLLVIGTAKLFVISAMLLMGLGTGLVYPNFLTVIAENLSPVQRSKGLSIFRFWRDLGYVAGALGAGLIAELFSIPIAFTVVAALTAAAGIMANLRMCCTFKLLWRSHTCTEAAAF